MGCGDKEALDDSACLTGPGGHHPPLPPTLVVCRLPFIGLLSFSLFFLAFSVYKATVREIQFPGNFSFLVSVHPTDSPTAGFPPQVTECITDETFAK